MLLKISKLEAAKRQLNTAVRLYFTDSDPISVHTLVAAAHEILSTLSRKHKGTTMILDLDFNSKEAQALYRKCLRAAKNFFKHADRDSDAYFIFDADLNEFFLYDACTKYSELTSEKIPEYLLFTTWFVLKYEGKLFNIPKNRMKEFEKYKENKALYFRDYFPIANELKS